MDFYNREVSGLTLTHCTTHYNLVMAKGVAMLSRVYGHFGPETLWTQDISALCVWCRSVSHFCVCRSVQWTLRHECRSVSDSSALKCMRHFGPRIKICFECVKNEEPLYIRYSNGLKVLGKRLSATNIIGWEAEECNCSEQR